MNARIIETEYSHPSSCRLLWKPVMPHNYTEVWVVRPLMKYDPASSWPAHRQNSFSFPGASLLQYSQRRLKMTIWYDIKKFNYAGFVTSKVNHSLCKELLCSLWKEPFVPSAKDSKETFHKVVTLPLCYPLPDLQIWTDISKKYGITTHWRVI